MRTDIRGTSDSGDGVNGKIGATDGFPCRGLLRVSYDRLTPGPCPPWELEGHDGWGRTGADGGTSGRRHRVGRDVGSRTVSRTVSSVLYKFFANDVIPLSHTSSLLSYAERPVEKVTDGDGQLVSVWVFWTYGGVGVAPSVCVVSSRGRNFRPILHRRGKINFQSVRRRRDE